MTGSSPAKAKATTFALGLIPSFFSPASLTSITAAAPSHIWLDVPAVSTPSSDKVFKPDKLSWLASKRIPSSTVTISLSPFGRSPSTGTISLSK